MICFFSNDVALSDFWDPVNGQILFKSTWTAPPPASRMSNTWHKSIHYTNQLLNGLWGSATRNYASHGPYFFSMTVLRHMYAALPYEFNLTTSHPFRHEKDVSIPFLYNQFALHYYQSVVAPNTINLYVKMTDDHKKMQHEFERLLSKRPKTVCLNDALSDRPGKALTEMHKYFHTLFPTKSKFELEEDTYM